MTIVVKHYNIVTISYCVVTKCDDNNSSTARKMPSRVLYYVPRQEWGWYNDGIEKVWWGVECGIDSFIVTGKKKKYVFILHELCISY